MPSCNAELCDGGWLLGGRCQERYVPQPRRAPGSDRDYVNPSQTASALEFFFQIHDLTTLNRQGND